MGGPHDTHELGVLKPRKAGQNNFRPFAGSVGDSSTGFAARGLWTSRYSSRDSQVLTSGGNKRIK